MIIHIVTEHEFTQAFQTTTKQMPTVCQKLLRTFLILIIQASQQPMG